MENFSMDGKGCCRVVEVSPVPEKFKAQFPGDRYWRVILVVDGKEVVEMSGPICDRKITDKICRVSQRLHELHCYAYYLNQKLLKTSDDEN